MYRKVSALYLTKRFYLSIAMLVTLFIFSYVWQTFFVVALTSFIFFCGVFLFELVVLFRFNGILATRMLPDRLSNGDENEIKIMVENQYDRSVFVEVIDEVPAQFQIRNLAWKLEMSNGEKKTLTYPLIPKKRGTYAFGSIQIFASFFIRLLERRYRFDNPKEVKVYPSFLQMRQYELAAITQNLSQMGLKRLRKLGASMEFEQIKEYVRGDDPRHVNWNASARTGRLMVNQYQDEKSQQVYCLIDKGRVMKMPFEGMSLLDYAINATLVLSSIAINRDDKAGFISFSKKMSTVIAASKKTGQMKQILEGLYNQRTLYEESNYELLASYVRKTITQRSLLVLFTNFESLSALKRQLPFLKVMAKTNVLVVILFKNTELNALISTDPDHMEAYYHQAIAEHLEQQKELIVRELKAHGIYGLLTEPKHLTTDTINKYIEVKARRF